MSKGNSPEATVRRRPSADTAPYLVLRLFLAAGWLRSAIEKLISRRWWNGAELREFFEVYEATVFPPYQWLIDAVLEPMAAPVSAVVVIGELLVVVLLLSGALRPGVLLGAFFNIHFVLAGAVNPSAFYLVMEVSLLLHWNNNRSDPFWDARSWLDHLRSLLRSSRSNAMLLLPAMATPFLALFARHFEPTTVKEDPALMLALLGILSTIGLVANRQPAQTIDLRAAAAESEPPAEALAQAAPAPNLMN